MPAGKVDPDVRSAERYGPAPVWERKGGGEVGKRERKRERERESEAACCLPLLVDGVTERGEASPRITMPRFGLQKLHANPPNIGDF